MIKQVKKAYILDIIWLFIATRLISVILFPQDRQNFSETTALLFNIIMLIVKKINDL